METEDRLAAFPARLRRLRQQSGMTQQEVADALSIHRTTYTKYETARANPDQESLLALARLFHVTVDCLLGQEDSPTDADGVLEDNTDRSGLTPREAELLEAFRRLSEEEQKRLLSQAHTRRQATRRTGRREKQP